MEIEKLKLCNETELIQLARKAGMPPLKRGLKLEEYLAILGGQEPKQEQIANSFYTRQKLQQYITKFWSQIVSQLPGCDGKCTTFPCSEGRHQLCFTPNEDLTR